MSDETTRDLALAHDLALAIDALRDVAQRSGPFSRDPLTHADNCIEAMGRRADDAIAALLSTTTEPST